MIRLLRWGALAFAYLVGAIAALWAIGALYFDLPWAALRGVASIILAFAFVSALIFLRGSRRKLGAIFAAFALVLAWWLTLKPSNEANWQTDVAQLGSAEINGDEVTLRNVRNFDYRTEADYTRALGHAHRAHLADHRHRPGDQLLGLTVDGAPHRQLPIR